jgi:hypothetical protein
MPAINSRDVEIQKIYPRLLSLTHNAADLDIRFEGTNIIVKIILDDIEGIPQYITSYIIKLWRTGETVGTATTDWWYDTWQPNNMLKANTLNEVFFNLLQLPNPPQRISEIGINYQIACRSVDTMNVTSAKSTLGSILIKTINV